MNIIEQLRSILQRFCPCKEQKNITRNSLKQSLDELDELLDNKTCLSTEDIERVIFIKSQMEESLDN